MLCYDIVWHGMLGYVMLCYAMLCYVMFGLYVCMHVNRVMFCNVM